MLCAAKIKKSIIYKSEWSETVSKQKNGDKGMSAGVGWEREIWPVCRQIVAKNPGHRQMVNEWKACGWAVYEPKNGKALSWQVPLLQCVALNVVTFICPKQFEALLEALKTLFNKKKVVATNQNDRAKVNSTFYFR